MIMLKKIVKLITSLPIIKIFKSKKKVNAILGEKCVLHEESSIINMQDNKHLLIGNNTHVRGELLVYPYGRGIKIGNDCYIGENSIIRSGDSIDIGNSVLIGHGCNIFDTDSHEIDYIQRDKSYKNMLLYGHPKDRGQVKTAPVIIKDFAWISFNVSILKGVTIGKGAIVGACSVVTHDVPDFCLAVGNPARVVKKICE